MHLTHHSPAVCRLPAADSSLCACRWRRGPGRGARLWALLLFWVGVGAGVGLSSLPILAQPIQQPLQAVAGSPPVSRYRLRPSATPPAGQTLHLLFALAKVNMAGVDAFLATQRDPASPEYRHRLTPKEFGQRFGAPEADVQAVVNYARSQGFRVTEVFDNRSFICADATVSQVERAFGVTMRGYDRPAGQLDYASSPSFIAPDGTPRLPAGIAVRLSAVLGLSDLEIERPMSHPARRRPGTGASSLLRSWLLPNATLPSSGGASGGPAPSPTGPLPFGLLHPNDLFNGPLGPAQLSQIYNIDALHNSGLHGESQHIAIYSPTLWDPKDLVTFCHFYGLGYSYRIHHSSDNSVGAGEAALDTETITGQASNAVIEIYECVNTAPNGITTFNQIAQDGLVSVLSSSWGIEENGPNGDVDGSYVSAFNTIAAQLAAQLISVFIASGDTGAYNDHIGSYLSVGVEAASPYVTAVGGTTLPSSSGGSWNAEDAWSWAFVTSDSWGSSGGLSLNNPLPSWQTGPGVQNSSSNGMRQVPDVAALAGAPDYNICFKGVWYKFTGTSAATPLWAAATLLMNQGAGRPLGNLDSQYYTLAAQSNSPFHDITSGNNGQYSCTPGWDFVTGLGSADFGQLYTLLTAAPNLTPYNPGKTSSGTWTSPIMIQTDQAAVAEPSSFTTGTTYYINCAIANLAPVRSPACVCDLQIDGVDHLFTPGPWRNNWYFSQYPFIGTLSAGTHTIKLIADSNNTVAESNEGDNVYTRVITVQGAAQPSSWHAAALSTGADGYSRLLWDSAGGTAAFWLLDPSNRFVSQVQYGPFPGWTAKALSTGRDLKTRALWTNVGGTAALWRLDANNNYLDQQQYGPFAGWTAVALSVGPDGYTRVLWTSTAGQAAVWLLDPGNRFVSQKQYGPFAGWVAKAVSTGPDLKTRVLWTSASGQAAFWRLDANNNYVDQEQYGPFAGWTATSLTAGADGYTRVLWDSADGTAAFWLLDPQGRYVSQQQYGPFAGWAAQGLVGGSPDASSRGLWVSVSGQIALWGVDPNNRYTGQQQFGPY